MNAIATPESAPDAGLGAFFSTLRRDLPVDYAWPGNVRELEQAVRRILLTGHYFGEQPRMPADEIEQLTAQIRAGTLAADELMRGFRHPLERRE